MDGGLAGYGNNRIPKSNINHPFGCDKCPGSFTRREHLLRHYRTHDNVKPYECSVCRQTFGRKDLRDRHERNLHQAARASNMRKTPTTPAHASIDHTVSTASRKSKLPITPERQRQLLKLFFTSFAPSMPVIHRSTFRPELRDIGLLKCILAIGGYYSADPALLDLSRIWIQEEWNSVRQSLSEIRHDDPRALDVMTEILLLTSYSLSQLAERPVEDSRDLLFESIQLGRKLGFGKVLVGGSIGPPGSLHYRWIEWIKYETFKRLNLMYHVMDSLLSCLHNRRPHLSLLELHQKMPVDESIWNTSSAEDWQTACLHAATETPIADAMFLLLNSYTLSTSLNELSSALISACLLNNIMELSTWKALYSAYASVRLSPQQGLGTGPQYGPEIRTREAQLKFAMNVLLEGFRARRIIALAPSPMWDITSAIQQFAYLRLYLPSVLANQGVVSNDTTSISIEIIEAIFHEDLVNVDYCPTSLLLTCFIELILGQVHLQYQDSALSQRKAYAVMESSIGCIILIQVMLDTWRLLRFTIMHQGRLMRSQELVVAQRNFLSTVHELVEAVGGVAEGPVVREDVLASTLAQLCSNMHRATRMSTFALAADRFARLTSMLQETTGELPGEDRTNVLNAWTMLSRYI